MGIHTHTHTHTPTQWHTPTHPTHTHTHTSSILNEVGVVDQKVLGESHTLHTNTGTDIIVPEDRGGGGGQRVTSEQHKTL